MAEPIKINTSQYTREGKVDIDGNIWSIRLPGAASDLRMSQQQRRLKVLEKKVESGDATDEDLDRCDRIELELYDDLKKIFNDGTKDNASVIKWMDGTPLAVIIKVIEDIKEQADGRKEPTASS